MRSADLEAQARAGDARAFGALLREWDHDLRGVAWAVVRSDHATDDIMQSAYEKAFLAIDNFDGRSSMKTWLHSICYRTAIDYVRYEGRRRHEDVTELAIVPDTADVADAAVASVELAETFDTLTEEQRVLLMLTAGLGYSFDETAEIVGIPRGTVASRVGRARQQLEKGGQR